MVKYVRVVKYDKCHTGGPNEELAKGSVGKVYKCLGKQYLDEYGLNYLLDIPGATNGIWIQVDHCEDVTEKYIDKIIEETEF